MDQHNPQIDFYKYYKRITKTCGSKNWSDNFAAGFFGAVAGGITGALEVSILYPAEFLKTQLQLDEGRKANKSYEGIIDCIRKTVKRNGTLGLYRGLSVLLFGTIPRSATRFGSFEYLKGTFPTEYKDHTINLLSGLGAGIFEAILIVTPLESIRVKFINDQNRVEPMLKGNFFNGVQAIVKVDGLKGIYRGVTATILKEGSSSAIRFSIVEYLKDYYKGDDPTKQVPKLYVGGFGAIAGFTSVLANTPIDVIKTRLQGLNGHKYKSTMDCFVQIYKKEGFSAMYRGTTIRLFLVGCSMAISFMVYDALMEHISENYLD